MIPVSLTLKGIYSYQKKQTIDFKSLTNNHLFGIFGPVGSGKSTILEAITFALYGETERLNRADNRSYNMMNLKSSELLIDFVFKGGNRNTELFRFTVQGSRDKKSFENTKTFDRRAFRHVNGNWEPIDVKTADNIIGLSYLNFRRTIIIPQGKFQEFLQISEADRTKMLKEIFNLDKFDLYAKTDLVDKKNAQALEGVKGQLIQIGDVNEKMIEKETQKLKELVGEREKVESIIKKEQENEAEMQIMKSLQSKINKQKEEVTRLELKAEFYQRKKNFLEKYEVCQKNFPDILNQKKEYEKEILNVSKTIEKIQNNINALTLMIRKQDEEFKSVKRQFEDRHKLEIRWQELESLISILQLDAESEKVTSNVKKLQDTIRSVEKKIDELKTESTTIDQTLKKLKVSLPDDTKLLDIRRWFDRHSTIIKRLEELKEISKEQTNEIDNLENQKNEIFEIKILSKYLRAIDRKKSLEEIINSLKEGVANSRKLLRARDKEIDSLKESEVLETFASHLKEGEPCPLCGAEHHPNVYAGAGVRTKINQLTKDKERLENDIESLQDCISDLDKINSKLETTQQSLLKIQKEINSKRSELIEHEEKFSWRGYTINDEERVDQEVEQAKKLKKQIKELESKKDQIEKALNDYVKERDVRKQELQSMDVKLSEIQGTKKALVGKVQITNLKKLDQLNERSLNKEISDLKEQFINIERKYKNLDAELQSNKQQLSTLSGTLQSEKKSLKSLQDQLNYVVKKLNERMQSTGFKELKNIEELLSEKIDVKKEKDEINNYETNLLSAKEQLDKLLKEQSGKIYDELHHQKIIEKIKEYKSHLKEIDQQIGTTKSRIRLLGDNLKKQNELLAEKKILENKSETLALMKRLFRGSKFVNYASRVYLENLCGIANQRFAQLTRQKLRLELHDDNSFQVRDFLNDGKVRSVKTLSGGQTFQASLSLALALADNVQQLARTEQSFFFLDEGFGSLDKESLAIAFETLKALRKENRIVGIISHVEELKQEIDNCVMVSLDEQEGSLIAMD